MKKDKGNWKSVRIRKDQAKMLDDIANTGYRSRAQLLMLIIDEFLKKNTHQ